MGLLRASSSAARSGKWAVRWDRPMGPRRASPSAAAASIAVVAERGLYYRLQGPGRKGTVAAAPRRHRLHWLVGLSSALDKSSFPVSVVPLTAASLVTVFAETL